MVRAPPDLPRKGDGVVAPTAARRIGTIEDDLRVPAGRVIVRQGEPCSGVSVVTHGALLESAVDDDGRVLGLDVLGRAIPSAGRTVRPPPPTCERSAPSGSDRWSPTVPGGSSTVVGSDSRISLTSWLARRHRSCVPPPRGPCAAIRTPGSGRHRWCASRSPRRTWRRCAGRRVNRRTGRLRALRDDGRVLVAGRGRFLIPTLLAVPGAR
jgi:hypothetical protein